MTYKKPLFTIFIIEKRGFLISSEMISWIPPKENHLFQYELVTLLVNNGIDWLSIFILIIGNTKSNVQMIFIE